MQWCIHQFRSLSPGQKRGKVYLSWTDTSLCETGFGFDRKGATFTADYMVNSKDVCFSAHAPTSVYDDLVVAPSVTVGSVQTYCIRAINEVGYDTGYRSDSACRNITIAWEASVSCVLSDAMLVVVNPPFVISCTD